MTKVGFDQVELARGKKQLQSNLMMNMETRPMTFEDIGRQMLVQNTRRSPLEYMDDIGWTFFFEIVHLDCY